MTWVLDSSALLCILNNEQGAERVEEVLESSQPVLIHAVNLVEVHYLLLRRGGAGAWRTAVARMHAAGIHIIRLMDDQLLATAAEIKAFHPPIALGDVFAVALTVGRGATLLTTDRGELEKVETAGVCSIEFLR
ncbi:MAG: PIN domain-containing protein [Chloroflexi bacterium]|nr:PIN domain-containing protein [Chloroflexota bacterium]